MLFNYKPPLPPLPSPRVLPQLVITGWYVSMSSFLIIIITFSRGFFSIVDPMHLYRSRFSIRNKMLRALKRKLAIISVGQMYLIAWFLLH